MRRRRRTTVVVVVAVMTLVVLPAAGADDVVPGPLRFEGAASTLFVVDDGDRYLDTLELRGGGDGAVLVNELGIDDYVSGVAEMPGGWPTEALKAQAVAARTYAWWSIEAASFDGYDICPTVDCQVFRGADTVLDSDRGERWRDAVLATAGEVLVLDDGRPLLARYFSTSGGRTYDNEEAFPDDGPRPHLVGIDDPYDAVSPLHRWHARFTRDEFDTILARGDTLGAATPVASVERLGPVDDPTADIRVTGTDGTTVDVSARDLRDFVSRLAPELYPDRFPGARADGFRRLPSTIPSTRFAVDLDDDVVVIDGQGWGHGVGLGQYGARGRAEDGHDYEEILAAYYDGRRPETRGDLPERVRVGLDAAASVTVTPTEPVRIVAGGDVVVERALGEWTASRDGAGWRLTPPQGHDDVLAVAPTAMVEGLDGSSDAVTVATEVNKPVLLRLEVVDDTGRTVLSRDLGTADAGRHTATWRFVDDDGEPVVPGTYHVVLSGEDAAGDQAGEGAEVVVERAARDGGDRLPVSPALSVVIVALVALAVAVVLLTVPRLISRTRS